MIAKGRNVYAIYKTVEIAHNGKSSVWQCGECSEEHRLDEMKEQHGFALCPKCGSIFIRITSVHGV
jgi:Zn finger protein HypA/HybF involved in hydrogenase expression